MNTSIKKYQTSGTPEKLNFQVKVLLKGLKPFLELSILDKKYFYVLKHKTQYNNKKTNTD